MSNENEKPTRQVSRQVTTPEAPSPKPKAKPKLPLGLPGYLGETVGGRYKITKKLGEGGMGAVYLAEHVVIEKKVAIKILTTQRSHEFLSRFAQEARAASKIGHENIIDITDYGDTDDGAVFLVMEYLEGTDLGREIRTNGPLSIKRCVRIMNQLCSALLAAHEKGIIHRDLKPDNLYVVERQGRKDFVKILDFGLARITDVPAGQRITLSGTILGTPEYMPPEQVRGETVDARADVYSAGCVLYELLTGDVPFRGSPYTLILAKHLEAAPEPPSLFNPSVGITPEIDAVVLKALAKTPDQRFQTMKELALSLCAATNTDPRRYWGDSAATIPVTVVAPVKARPSPPKPARSWPWLVGLTALGMALGFALMNAGRSTPPAPPPLAVPIAAAPVVIAASPPARPATITIGSEPSGADVKKGSERLGHTPLELQLPTDTQPFAVTLSRHGYRDAPLEVHPDRDRDYVVALPPAPKGPSRPATVEPTAQSPSQTPAELKGVFSE